MIAGKNVIVGVCGGIAAYKVVDVVSRLKKKNIQVHTVMTENAAKFVTPLTFRSISQNPVVTDMFKEPDNWDIQHIALAHKADLILVAPATANIIGKIACGIADDMLTTVILATRAPVLLVPAMNCDMYENPILKENISRLKARGYFVMEPDSGLLACGDVGKGRMPEPERIVSEVEAILSGTKRDLAGFKVLVTAGPTREFIDPVRYITNRSSGKMGYAVASAASDRGAGVILVTGPVDIKQPGNVEVYNVNSCEDMYKTVMDQYEKCDILIMMAAVADYRCAEISGNKIKKSGAKMTLELVKNPDIALEIGKIKGSRIHVGACAETDNLLENAKSKLVSKNFDLIMANDVTKEGAGFETDTNIVSILGKDGYLKELPLMSKRETADRLLDEVVEIIKRRY